MANKSVFTNKQRVELMEKRTSDLRAKLKELADLCRDCEVIERNTVYQETKDYRLVDVCLFLKYDLLYQVKKLNESLLELRK